MSERIMSTQSQVAYNWQPASCEKSLQQIQHAAENSSRLFVSDISIDQVTSVRWFINRRSLKSKFNWRQKQGSPQQFLDDCCGTSKLGHREREIKDGSCFVPGAVEGDARNVNAIAALYSLWLDLDKASMAEVEEVEAE